MKKKVVSFIEKGFAGDTKRAFMDAIDSPELVRTDIDNTKPVTPEEARKLLTVINGGEWALGGTEGWIDRVFESELIEVALGSETKPLKSFWVALDTSTSYQMVSDFYEGKLFSQEIVERILADNPKPFAIKDIQRWKKQIEGLNKQGAVFEIDDIEGIRGAIKREREVGVVPKEPAAEVIPIETAKPKAKPTKRVPLVTTFTNPVNKKKVVATFPDEDSVRVYNDLNKETRRVKGIKLKPKKESPAFRRYIKDKYGLNSSAYAKLVADYKKKIKDDVLKAQEAGVTEIQAYSFEAFVADQLGGASPNDIEKELTDRNISISDKAFKKWLKVNTGVDDFKRCNWFKT